MVMAVVSIPAYHMWQSGQLGQIAAVPQNRRERRRLLWVVVFAVNFLAFLAHGLRDGGCAFFGTGRYVDGHYVVVDHGREISFTPGGYWFSCWHSVIFLVLFITCVVAIRLLSRGGELKPKKGAV